MNAEYEKAARKHVGKTYKKELVRQVEEEWNMEERKRESESPRPTALGGTLKRHIILLYTNKSPYQSSHLVQYYKIFLVIIMTRNSRRYVNEVKHNNHKKKTKKKNSRTSWIESKLLVWRHIRQALTTKPTKTHWSTTMGFTNIRSRN